MNLLQKLFGDPNAREVAKMRPVIDKINGLASSFEALTDEGLKAKTLEFKDRLAKGASLDDLLPEAFAAVREASRRTTKLRQYDVQLIGGMALHKGTIAEMRTGEGKTLVSTAPAYLNALSGKGVHIVTVNDYLARRDAVWMGQVHHALGLSVGIIQHAASFIYDPAFKTEPTHDANRDQVGSFRVDTDYLRPVTRKEAYAADITYGTNNEFGFDYLRDNMVQRKEEMVQRDLNFAIIDEVDSILIDEARTPLIISAPAEEAGDLYYRFAELVPRLAAKDDYLVDEKVRSATLTEAGIAKIEGWLGVENLYMQGGMKLVHHLEQALRAHALYKKDKDYVVREGEVVIVDEFTGRLMVGRRYSEGLHQAIEAKERVPIQRESLTLATITFQNLFRLYTKLSGMTGTAATEAEEFHKIYKLDVLSIPTNRENKRKDLTDRVYKTELGKYQAVVQEVKLRHEQGQPILIGTVSIEKNELMSELLKQAGIPHNILNAKNHEREAEFIAQAGRKGAVTVATNMAGRGVDIILGGNPPEVKEAEEVRALGGLHVLGTERHESRRIDNQLRGRAGRQGDPGTTQFYVSMEDDLMRIFGSDRMKTAMDRLGLPDNEAIENRMLTSSLESAQRKVEGHNFDIRKHLLEYDDILNKHRTVIYKKRRELLELIAQPTHEGERVSKAKINEIVQSEIETLVAYHTSAEDPGTWELDKLEELMKTMVPDTVPVSERLHVARQSMEGKEDLVAIRTELVTRILEVVKEAYAKVEESVGDSVLMADIEKTVMLRSIDDLWIEHLETMDHLRKGVGLQGYGQRDPLVEYKKEAYRLFHEFLARINERVTRTIFKVQITREVAQQQIIPTQNVQLSGPSKEGDQNLLSNEPAALEAPSSSTSTPSTPDFKLKDVGRNDVCPCGSGKKFKKCHGA
jgi:preprotein translocase subunit SecA